MTWLRIGGYPATEIAAHSPVTWETWADGGSGLASWVFALSRRSQHQALTPGRSLVEILCGPMPLWTGILSEFDRMTGECHASGLASAASQYLALDGTGANTRNMGTAIATAQAAGWQATNLTPITGPVAGDGTDSPITVAQLLGEYATQTGQRWGVDGQARVFMSPTPSSVSWLATPDETAYGTTDEDRAAKLVGTYLDATTSTNARVVSGSGAPQVSVDLTDRGPLSLAAAQAILAGLLQRDYAQTAWTNGVTLTRDQLQTMGGAAAFLPAVCAGQVMRSPGLFYGGKVQSIALDTTIGKTRYTSGESTIYIEPVETAPRNYVDVSAAA